jgi:hypothetical protein
MKKLFIILLFIPLLGVGQNYVTKKFVVAHAATADTGYQFNVSENYTWQIVILWSSNNGTTGTVKIQQTVNGADWFDYANLESTTVTGTTGSVAYEDDRASGLKLRVLFTAESGKTATFNMWYNLKRR